MISFGVDEHARHVIGHPVGGQLGGGRHQVAVNAPQQPAVGFSHAFLEIGNAAHLPQQRDGMGAGGSAFRPESF